MSYAVVYVRGHNLNVDVPKPSEVIINGVLQEVSINFIGKTGKILKFNNEYANLTLRGLAINVRYVSKDLVIIEGLIKDYEVRPEESLTVTLYTFETPELQEPDLDEGF